MLFTKWSSLFIICKMKFTIHYLQMKFAIIYKMKFSIYYLQNYVFYLLFTKLRFLFIIYKIKFSIYYLHVCWLLYMIAFIIYELFLLSWECSSIIFFCYLGTVIVVYIIFRLFYYSSVFIFWRLLLYDYLLFFDRVTTFSIYYLGIAWVNNFAFIICVPTLLLLSYIQYFKNIALWLSIYYFLTELPHF